MKYTLRLFTNGGHLIKEINYENSKLAHLSYQESLSDIKCKRKVDDEIVTGVELYKHYQNGTAIIIAQY